MNVSIFFFHVFPFSVKSLQQMFIGAGFSNIALDSPSRAPLPYYPKQVFWQYKKKVGEREGGGGWGVQEAVSCFLAKEDMAGQEKTAHDKTTRDNNTR
jgi:hypothetical protein